MFRLLLPVIIISAFLSCSTNDRAGDNCRYTKSDLLRDIDTALIDTRIYDGFSEIMDKGSNAGVKGIYKFDSNQTLRFYAFLLNGANDYEFSKTYDSSGREVDRTGSEVIQWYFRKLPNDSIKLTFYLYGLHQKFDNVRLISPSIGTVNIELFKSPIFSNILGGSIIKTFDLEKDSVIRIFGDKENECTSGVQTFRDSTKVPPDLYQN